MHFVNADLRKRLRPWLWFAALYVGALLVYAAVTLLLRLIMAR